MKKEGLSLKRVSFLTGKRKVGLDTNILIKLYEQPGLFDYEEARIFNEKNAVFIHPISLLEFANHLKKKGANKEEADAKVKEFTNRHNISTISYFVHEKEINDFEGYSNEKFKQMKMDYLKCHKPDSIILLAFKKCGINKIISTDEAFRICAEFLGINASKLPSLDFAISRELKKIFDYKKKFKKKRN